MTYMEENAKRLAEAVLHSAIGFEHARNYGSEYLYCVHCQAQTTRMNRDDIEHDSECPVIVAQSIMQSY